MSFPYHVKGAARVELGRKWGLSSAAKRKPSEPDGYTLHMRALHDARGMVVRHGCTYFGDGRVVPWSVRRSVRGRVNQYDVMAGAEIWRTAGPRKLPAFIRP
jgi:hypothetical protein